MNKKELGRINMKLTTILVVVLSIAYNKQEEMLISILVCVAIVVIGEVLSWFV